MGNTVGIELSPPPIEELLSKSFTQNEDNRRTQIDSYSSILRGWIFSGDDIDIINRPIVLQQFQGFNDSCCYIVLHIYKNNRLEMQIEDNVEIPKQSPLSILDIASSTENLSPRGQCNSFGGYHSSSGILKTTQTNDNQYQKYDIYIWNGKNAHPVIKASSLAKIFELDGVLRERKISNESFTQISSKIVPISKIFLNEKINGEQENVTDVWNSLLQSNHLFHTINTSCQFISTLTTTKKKGSLGDLELTDQNIKEEKQIKRKSKKPKKEKSGKFTSNN